MMNKNILVFIIAIIGYPILIFFCTKFHKESYVESMCYFSRPCARFCCKIESECTESYVEEKFNTSLLFENPYFTFYEPDETTENETEKNFQLYFGKPQCFLTEPKASGWNFSTVSGEK